MNNQENKPLGTLKNILFDIDSPMDFETDINLRELTLMTGLNGIGKSLTLKVTWCINYIAQSYLMAKEQGLSNFPLLDFAQHAFNKSFDDQDFNGKIEVKFEDDKNDVIIEFDKGKITKFDLNFQPNVISSGMPVFMSTETRTYSNIVKYLILRKSLGIKGSMDNTNAHLFEGISDHYKLYDILFIERFITKLQKPLIFTKDLKDALKKFDLRFNVESIGLDLNKPEIYFIDDKGNVKSITSLSAGEQSIFNIIVSNYVQ